jgi:hypothetical protein
LSEGDVDILILYLQARKLKNQLFWRKIQYYILIAVGVVVSLFSLILSCEVIFDFFLFDCSLMLPGGGAYYLDGGMRNHLPGL